MNDAGGVKVAVVAAGEVMRGGLARMLERTAGVDSHAVFAPEEFAAEAAEDTIQLLILSCDVLVLWAANGTGFGDSAWAADLAGVAQANGILVVLVLPAVELKRGTPVTIACDGVLEQEALTTARLGDALRRLADGEKIALDPLPRVAHQRHPLDGPSLAAPPPVLLTARESQVLELLVEGLSNKQIGQALALSEHSAKRLVAIVLSKLNSPNRTQAVAVALREGLVRPDAGVRGPLGPSAE
ncbi:LuxR C-terminal-related transcriptional regulator [Streptomyces sp. NPDC057638]|uniref:helix-turn-helix transcriptional regulator n=1 Tax=Streptomyces sp. NPDC057638 TaxID=3346190 RepID=UPI003689D83E